ncbi:MAG: hypothetical protein V3V20_11760 [Algisphaera sp.]
MPSTPFEVANPAAANIDDWEYNVVRPRRIADLQRLADELDTQSHSPALGMGERIALKRRIEDLNRRIEDLSNAPQPSAASELAQA